jgi:hypothetical protein
MLQLRLGPSLRSRIADPVSRRCAEPARHRSGPLPRQVAERVRASAAALAALLEVEGRSTVNLDDLEWADAVAARLVARHASAGPCGCGRKDQAVPIQPVPPEAVPSQAV